MGHSRDPRQNKLTKKLFYLLRSKRFTFPLSNLAPIFFHFCTKCGKIDGPMFVNFWHQGINFDKFDNIPVRLTGDSAPRPIATFEEGNLHKSCLENIKRAKYLKPTPVQKYALPSVLARRDLMACAQTGSGKTGAFLIPIISNIMNEGVQSSTDGECCYPLVS